MIEIRRRRLHLWHEPRQGQASAVSRLRGLILLRA